RASLALGAVARGRFDHRDTAGRQPRGQLRLAERRERQTEMVEVRSGRGRRRLTQRPVEGHQVNETAPRAQLRQAQRGLLALHPAPEYVAVEREGARRGAHAPPAVIDALDGKRRSGHSTTYDLPE